MSAGVSRRSDPDARLSRIWPDAEEGWILRSQSGPLRVALYSPAGRGGICHYTWELAEHLAQTGNDVVVLTTSDYELADAPRHFRIRYVFKESWIRRIASRFTNLAPRRRGSLAAPAGARTHGRPEPRGRLRDLRMRLLHLRLLAEFIGRRPDVVHFQWLADRERDLALIRMLRKLRIPVVFTAHDVLPQDGDSPEERVFLSRLYSGADTIVVHTEVDRNRILQAFGRTADRVAVIPHGTYDFRFGRDAGVDRVEARRRLGIPPEKNVVLFFGLIKRYKGLEHLVSAFERVQQQLPGAFLLIVGEVYGGDAAGHRFYSELLERLRGRDRVRVITTYVPISDIPTYFASAEVVVLPYTRSSQSGVLLAAYGAGRPVIVTRAGGLSEIVEQDQTGLAIAPGDPAALARALLLLLGDISLARAMGERAGQLGVTKYGWRDIALATTNMYRKAARARRRSGVESPAEDREEVLTDATRRSTGSS